MGRLGSCGCPNDACTEDGMERKAISGSDSGLANAHFPVFCRQRGKPHRLGPPCESPHSIRRENFTDPRNRAGDFLGT